MTKTSKTLAIVLAGGGARGAYEAGVLEYILTDLPVDVIEKIHFKIICGTSVGALNACFMAAVADDKQKQAAILTDTWTSLTLDRVYDFSWKEVKRLPRFLKGSGGLGSLDDLGQSGRKGGVFNTAPLEHLMRTGIDWNHIEDNIKAGHLDALIVNALHLGSGEIHSFIQSDLSPQKHTQSHQRRFIPTRIQPKHALASSAIPWIFPAIEIDGYNYVDGSMRLNTPISPVIRLGADKVFVIGLNSPEEFEQPKRHRIDQFPSALSILERIASALLQDNTHGDLERLEQVNKMLERGVKEFGDGFLDVLNQPTGRQGAHGYRQIKTQLITPSENISVIANEYIQQSNIIDGLRGFMKILVERIALASLNDPQSMTLSSILFDGGFASKLIELGRHDAHMHRQELIEFFKAH